MVSFVYARNKKWKQEHHAEVVTEGEEGWIDVKWTSTGKAERLYRRDYDWKFVSWNRGRGVRQRTPTNRYGDGQKRPLLLVEQEGGRKSAAGRGARRRTPAAQGRRINSTRATYHPLRGSACPEQRGAASTRQLNNTPTDGSVSGVQDAVVTQLESTRSRKRNGQGSVEKDIGEHSEGANLQESSGGKAQHDVRKRHKRPQGQGEEEGMSNRASSRKEAAPAINARGSRVLEVETPAQDGGPSLSRTVHDISLPRGGDNKASDQQLERGTTRRNASELGTQNGAPASGIGGNGSDQHLETDNDSDDDGSICVWTQEAPLPASPPRGNASDAHQDTEIDSDDESFIEFVEVRASSDPKSVAVDARTGKVPVRVLSAASPHSQRSAASSSVAISDPSDDSDDESEGDMGEGMNTEGMESQSSALSKPSMLPAERCKRARPQRTATTHGKLFLEEEFNNEMDEEGGAHVSDMSPTNSDRDEASPQTVSDADAEAATGASDDAQVPAADSESSSSSSQAEPSLAPVMEGNSPQDEGNGMAPTREASHPPPPPPPFPFPFTGGEFTKPKVGGLISVRRDKDTHYLGVVCSQRGNISKTKFYFGPNSRREPVVETHDIITDKKHFEQGCFRPRPELRVGSRCYDYHYKMYCTLRSINTSRGSVQLHYDGEESELEMFPDHLVMVPKTGGGSTATLQPAAGAAVHTNASNSCNLEAFWTSTEHLLPRQRPTYSKPPNFLLQEWRSKIDHSHFEENFDSSVRKRAKIRKWANQSDDRRQLTVAGLGQVQEEKEKILQRMLEDFNLPTRNEEIHDFKGQITRCKALSPSPNWLLLCGGFGPEVVAWKRLMKAGLVAPLGMVVVQDTDISAVSVAVAAHPDVEFGMVLQQPDSKNQPRKPGEVLILLEREVVRELEVRIGGIHHASATSPCQSFSLAGKKKGFNDENGQVFWDCIKVLQKISRSSEMPTYKFENVLSTKDTNERFDKYLPDGNEFFTACASMCSPSLRKRKYATNVPPPVCSQEPKQEGQPPSLQGDHPALCAPSICNNTRRNRMVHPKLKKLPCLLHSKKTNGTPIWRQQDSYTDPESTDIRPDEAERAMGYREEELGVTSLSAERAVRKRIKDHDFKTKGCLVSFKGCAGEFPLEKVTDTRRLQLLGNSECVTMLEALMWREKELFPPLPNRVD